MALKVDPGFAPARANLGRLLFARGAIDEAREEFLRLTQAAPESPDGWLGLAESLVRLGRPEEADAVVERARGRFGDLPALELLVARQLLRGGAFDEAERMLTPLTHDADRARRGVVWAWIAVARVGEKDDARAREAARLALEVNPDDAVARYAMRAASAQ